MMKKKRKWKKKVPEKHPNVTLTPACNKTDLIPFSRSSAVADCSEV